MDRDWKGIYSRRNYCKIEITGDSIEQGQLVNSSIWKIEKAALNKNQNNINYLMIIVNFILK